MYFIDANVVPELRKAKRRIPTSNSRIEYRGFYGEIKVTIYERVSA